MTNYANSAADTLLARLSLKVSELCDAHEAELRKSYLATEPALRSRSEAERQRRRKERERKEREERERIEARRREEETRERRRKDEIIGYLREQGIEHLYHFTSEENLAGIREHGGLFAWKVLEEKGWACPSPGGTSLSRSLDTRDRLERKVRLSFCSDHPMAYRLMQGGKRLVLLRIDVAVAAERGVLFTNMNATKNGCRKGEGIAFLRDHVRFDAINEHFLRSDDPMFPYHQAEVMVEGHVPAEKILNIKNPQLLS